MNYFESFLQQFLNIIQSVKASHINVLGLLGLALFGGTFGAKIFQAIKIPQVVGYIFIGILVGLSGFKIIDQQLIEKLEPFNLFALGIIGFMIGGELKLDVLRKYGKQFVGILLGEALLSFILVTLVIGFAGQFFLPDQKTSWSLALLLGAISSATAPAATTDVLWEFKTKGPLTTTVFGIVAMDDALALLLFSLASSVATSLMEGMNTVNWHQMIIRPVHEVCGAISIGVVTGWVMMFLIRRYVDKDKVLAVSLGFLLLAIGFSLTIGADMLLTSMTLGMVVTNILPRRSAEIFKVIGGFAPPIYVLFFVLVGAKLNIYYVTPLVALLAFLYVAARTGGKWLGSWIGAAVTKAPESVKKFLPYCLFSQAGVAIGLSIVASHVFEGEIGSMIVVVITTTTFVVQLIGPPMTKLAVIKAGEVGLNVTEEDLLNQMIVRDLMDKEPPMLYLTTPLTVILRAFGEYDYLNYPVVDDNRNVIGIITVDSVRQTFMEQDMSDLFLAADLMEPVRMTTRSDISAAEMMKEFHIRHLDHAVVVNDKNQLIGFVEERRLERIISKKLIELQQKVAELG